MDFFTVLEVTFFQLMKVTALICVLILKLKLLFFGCCSDVKLVEMVVRMLEDMRLFILN